MKLCSWSNNCYRQFVILCAIMFLFGGCLRFKLICFSFFIIFTSISSISYSLLITNFLQLFSLLYATWPPVGEAVPSIPPQISTLKNSCCWPEIFRFELIARIRIWFLSDHWRGHKIVFKSLSTGKSWPSMHEEDVRTFCP